MWHTEALNSLEGQTQIFDFIGLPKSERKYHVGVKVNVSEENLITRTPTATVSNGGSPCNFCDENKADWRLTNEKANVFVYACDPCRKYGKNLGRFQNSVTI